METISRLAQYGLVFYKLLMIQFEFAKNWFRQLAGKLVSSGEDHWWSCLALWIRIVDSERSATSMHA